jgi:hypothetical protein
MAVFDESLPIRTEVDGDAVVSISDISKGAQTNDINVRDAYSAVEYEADQNGANAVLTFTLSADADFIIVDADNITTTDYTAFRCRATIDGTTPSATVGFVCRSGQSTYLPFPSGSVVKVYAQTGVVVAVQAGRY